MGNKDLRCNEASAEKPCRHNCWQCHDEGTYKRYYQYDMDVCVASLFICDCPVGVLVQEEEDKKKLRLKLLDEKRKKGETHKRSPEFEARLQHLREKLGKNGKKKA